MEMLNLNQKWGKREKGKKGFHDIKESTLRLFGEKFGFMQINESMGGKPVGDQVEHVLVQFEWHSE